ncbi:Crp/Fnr family transcriptional regulator [Limibaculum sp. M0105]|uniref:Crp/Fnr family transcriptional regulator n=1 Tax=Thermohalobaculum xanthum TaxID=2753746 RepID=A0A8J7M5U3_9RHOB|nr:cyclic nucleotide-binding domain-containing protein [Thermohalobaculum xanthum]MBK0398658.1 Crp/Fnr family transcriptional regulator [Thermohalobaculum xanthum]
MSEVRFRSGETIFEEGSNGTECYKILSGAAEVRVRGKGREHWGMTMVAATCGPGEFIGEMSAFDGAPRSATVVAVEDMTCKVYSGEAFLKLLETDHEEALEYLRVLVQRLKQSNVSMSWGTRTG